MKKIIFSLILFIGLNATAQFINVSTGVDNSGNALPAGSVDPNWQIAASPNPPTTPALVSAPFPGAWENTPTSGVNAGWINSTGNPNFTNLPGDYTFERPFTVGIGNTNIDYNLNAAWDDVFIAFEFVRPDGSTIPIAITPNSLSPRYLSTSIPSSLTTTMNGVWKIRGIINFIDGAGGFLMGGTITITTTPCDKWSLCGNTTTVTDFLGTINNQPLNFKTNNTQRMIVDATGKVGIGTSLPSSALHLFTGSNPGMLPPNFILERNDGTNQAGVLTVGISSNGFASGLLGGGSAYFKLEDPFGNSMNSDMGFSTNGLASQLVIKHNGYVGIGTETPAQKVHVKDGALLLSGAVAGFGGPQLLFSDNETTHPNGRWGIEYITATSSRPSMGGLNFWTPFNPIGPSGTAGNYSLFLKDDGKIGMGATDDSSDANFCASALPNGYRLYVNGGILTTKVKVANYCSTSWADYVFANDYNLKPLSEVESFIKENKHLPNIPSATELEKEGLDLGIMQSLQMAKIEELTLYMIEMKKEIEILKTQNESLKTQMSKN